MNTQLVYYKPKHFIAEELVSKEIYDKFKDRSFMFFSPSLLYTIDQLRESFGPATINNWKWIKTNPFTQRGLRTKQVGTATFSPHFFGKAFDLSFKNVTAEEARQYIKKNSFKVEFAGIKRIEEGVTWLHIDEFNTGQSDIVYFKA